MRLKSSSQEPHQRRLKIMVNIEAARKILSTIPKSKYNNIIRDVIIREDDNNNDHTKIIIEMVKN